MAFIRNKLNARNRVKELKKYPEVYKNVSIRNKRFVRFVSEYFNNLSKPYEGWGNLVRLSSENYDAFLCGSDQLWLPHNLGSHFYTLEFAPDSKPKIAYATSFGVSQIPKFQKKRTAKYLNRFQYLSTREITGKKIIKELIGTEVKVVSDPTLLFDREGWLKIIHDKTIIDTPYIYCYLLGTNPEHRRAALELSKIKGIKIVTTPFLDNFVEEDMNFGDIQLFDLDSSDFVNLVRHAEYVLTDSFHGTVFSILNQKRFLTFNRFAAGTNSRNSRIDSLCTILGLEKRRFNGDVSLVDDPIDFPEVYQKTSDYRDKSLQYLENSLSSI